MWHPINDTGGDPSAFKCGDRTTWHEAGQRSHTWVCETKETKGDLFCHELPCPLRKGGMTCHMRQSITCALKRVWLPRQRPVCLNAFDHQLNSVPCAALVMSVAILVKLHLAQCATLATQTDPNQGMASWSAAASGPMRGGRCRRMDGQMRAVQTDEQKMKQTEPRVDAERPPKKPPGRAM
jgi:hypothetical protein